VAAVPHAEPFFLDGVPGQRFCLFHPPAGPCRGALLYVHPFAEEMNRARRMAALGARALAARGYGVLLLDLYGCGDSSGDFGDARWDIWKDDVARGAAWLQARTGHPAGLWGLRLGALLALDYARSASHPIPLTILWQPVANAATHLTQFLRLRVAAAMQGDKDAQTSTNALRQALAAGETIEVAGYDLAPALAHALDKLDPLEALAPSGPVHWFETPGPGQALATGSVRAADAWAARGIDLQIHALASPPFWTTPEITVGQEWLAATAAITSEEAIGHR
jgi:exosortase A-associated hydrolase 2